MHRAAMRRIKGLMTAEIIVYDTQNMWISSKSMIELPETQQEALGNDGG